MGGKPVFFVPDLLTILLCQMAKKTLKKAQTKNKSKTK